MMAYHRSHEVTMVVWLTALAGVVLAASSAWALRNPAAVYCRGLGYEYYTAESKRGLLGVCELPDGRQVNAWSFYRGKVALEWSYCAQQGYESRHVEGGDVCRNCLVCVMPDNQEIWVVELMGLSFRESKCGDGHCGTTEDYGNCPGDCSSGGLDELCDGVGDSRCDPDCVMQGGTDPDCPGLFVDIKPGSCPNPLSTKSKGVLPVALLGTAQLGVSDIDPGSVRLSFEGSDRSLAPLRWALEDVGTPNPAQACGQCWSVPGDRKPDLALKFDSEAVNRMLRPARVSGQGLPLRISARLKDGTEVWGEDCVKLVPKKNKR